jgi:predicted NUDIX family NTP pyrophosphohydrolase
LEVLLAHPGGPLFAHRDDGHWTIPKGEVEGGGDLLETARREFTEETGLPAPTDAEYLALGSIQQKGGKWVHAWGVAGDVPPGYRAISNRFSMEWPPGSGRSEEFPEVDRAEFFPLPQARLKIKPSQIPLLDTLERLLVRPQ